MKTIITFSILFIILILSYCSDPSSPEQSDRFAIYLLKEASLTTKDVQERELSRLILREKPVISYNDIIGYQIEDHKVYLNEKLSYYLDKDSLKVFSQIFGTPFVLIAKNERIYLGSFYTSISSWLPKTPIIENINIFNMNEKLFIISSAPHYDEEIFIDVRNDERIIQALGDKILYSVK